jgi:cytochrome c553
MKMLLALLFMEFAFLNNLCNAQAPFSLAATCTSCHGEHGISPNDFWPNLAGQKRTYLLEQLKAFKNGERKNPIMSPVAKMLNEEDMEKLATHFSRLELSK